MFSVGSVPRTYLEDNRRYSQWRCSKRTPITKRSPTPPFLSIRRNNERRKKNKFLILNKYMAMDPSGARCQEWPCWLVACSKLLHCSALLYSQSVEMKVQLWSVNQRATEADESPLLRFVTRKRLVKTRQKNSRCGECYQVRSSGNGLRRLRGEWFVV
jgi:hypothetical protein